MKLALFGGSFDPPHLGHLRLTDFLLEKMALDRLVVSVANVSPFKTDAESTVSDEDRLELCRRTFTDPRVEVSDYEIRRGGVSYSVDVVRYWKEKKPKAELFFVVGEDQLLQFHRWRQYEEILSMATLVAVRREKSTPKETLEAYLKDHPEIGKRALLLDYDPLPMSSTGVRSAVAAFRDLKPMLSPAAADYVEKRGLYLPERERAMIEDVRTRLTDFRFFHTMCVAASAKTLALRFGADPGLAYVSGLLHDACKELSYEESLRMLDDRGVPLTPLERRTKKLHHQLTGAIYAKEAFGVPEDVSRAIRFHTTGREGMDLLEKVLFVADFVSDDRDYPGVEEMRRRAETSLELTMEEGLRFTIEDLARECRPIHPDTIAAYNEILLSK